MNALAASKTIINPTFNSFGREPTLGNIDHTPHTVLWQRIDFCGNLCVEVLNSGQARLEHAP